MKNLPNLYDELLAVYKQHGDLIIALDFDDTIYDWKRKGWDCDYVVDLIKRLQYFMNARVILFTCREGLLLDFAIAYTESKGVKLWGINSDPDHPEMRKPFYNVMVDDKACLSDVCNVLELLMETIRNET
jgi:hypothetical protein